MGFWQGFAIGSGVTSLVWLLVGFVIRRLLIVAQERAIGRMFGW